jgi:putative sugar O-methyltransferase
MTSVLSSRRALARAAKLVEANRHSVLFVSPLLRAREVKMASALRQIGWKVVLIHLQNTPFAPEDYFDIAIQARTEREAHSFAKTLRPRICHAFSGAVDGLLLRLCRDKPGPLVIDLNDVFCPSLFNYCTERFEPTRECLAKADALCARDIQARAAHHLDGFPLPKHTLLFPEYTWADPPPVAAVQARFDSDEVRVVSVGTFCLESRGEYDSCYLKLAELLAAQKIHLHIYPHWFYKESPLSAFNWDLAKDFTDFFALQRRTDYIHIHDSIGFEALATELLAYDFGIVSGGCAELGQHLGLLKSAYMTACYSGRISDYLDARLPILINKEVGFNFQLLRHYRVEIDLCGVLQPGFRDLLLSVKRDRGQHRVVEEAAKRLSVGRHASRLAALYERVIAGRPQPGIPRWLSLPYKVPLLGPRLGHLKRNIEGLHQTIEWQRQNAQKQRRLRQNERDFRMQQNRESYIELHALRQQSHSELNALLQESHSELDALRHQSQSELDALRQQSQSELDALRQQSQSELDALRQQQERDLNSLRRQHHRELDVLLLHNANMPAAAKRTPLGDDLVSGLLNWPEINDEHERANGFCELLRLMRLSSLCTGRLTEISSAWELLSQKHLDELLRNGYRDFKRTIGCNYFNFLVQNGDPQMIFLEAALSPAVCFGLRTVAQSMPNDPNLQLPDQVAYRYFVLLLWTYAQNLDAAGYLDRLDEPQEGNPITIEMNGRRISSDLVNSVLEYYSISEVMDFSKCRRVLEIGGGYGRSACSILQLNQHIQYTLVDVPPALYLAERYLSSVLERKIFRVRHFDNFDDVKSEMERCSVIFLLPHQLCLLPDRRFDLTLNISSFGEMQPQMIAQYFDEIDRLTQGVFYTKQWKISKNPFDGIDVTKEDYPVKGSWQLLYQRDARVQTEFFEAAYLIGGTLP